MTHFIKQGAAYFVTDNANLDLRPKLPVGTYGIAEHPEKGLFLYPIEDLTFPKKVYGNAIQHAERILNTYQSRESNTGVLLSGEKGGGKTMLLRTLSATLRQAGIPTIVIASPYSGETFNKFMQSIDQPCMIAIDEFEKMYADNGNYSASVGEGVSQNNLLSLMDGLYNGKKLFVLTSNSESKINSHMFNRPGRLFYHIKFRGLDTSVVEEYCKDHLKNKEHMDSMRTLLMRIDNFNFDLMQAVVEEMNRYNEPADAAVKLMNIRAESSKWVDWKTEAYLNGKKVESWGPANGSNPFAQRRLGGPTVYIDTGRRKKEGTEDEEKVVACFQISLQNLRERTFEGMTFEDNVTVEGQDYNIRLVYTRQEATYYDAF